MTLDDATQAFLRQLAEIPSKPRHQQSPAEAREGLHRLRRLLGDGPQDLRRCDLSIPLEDGGSLPLRLIQPVDPVALLVFLHGGGWVIGSNDDFEPMCRSLASASGAAVAMVEYRTAPERTYPGPVEDAWAALVWCAEHAEEMTGAPARLLIGGDSAGGNDRRGARSRNR